MIFWNVLYIYTSKKPPCERELISNQAKKVVLIKKIFIAFLNKLQITYQNEN